MVTHIKAIVKDQVQRYKIRLRRFMRIKQATTLQPIRSNANILKLPKEIKKILLIGYNYNHCIHKIQIQLTSLF